MKKKSPRRKGVVAYFYIFVMLSVIMLFLMAFAIPLLMDFNIQIYSGGELALDDATSWLDKISDADVKAQIEATLNASKDSIPEQIDVMGFFFQYSWIIMILVILFVVFMFTRVTVEQEIR